NGGTALSTAMVDVEIAPLWHDDLSPLDTDGNASIDTLDILKVITAMNLMRPGAVEELEQLDSAFAALDGGKLHPDVNNDGFLSALDALIVLQEVDRRLTLATNGESVEVGTQRNRDLRDDQSQSRLF
ncbi:MAG: dockerin type I domain-containing protein, partial [Planctomycetota bacterium]